MSWLLWVGRLGRCGRGAGWHHVLFTCLSVAAYPSACSSPTPTPSTTLQVFDTRTLRCVQTCRDRLVLQCSAALFTKGSSKLVTLGSHGRAWSVIGMAPGPPASPADSPTAAGSSGTGSDAGERQPGLLLDAFYSPSLAQVGMPGRQGG
jgi:hypothetical protein